MRDTPALRSERDLQEPDLRNANDTRRLQVVDRTPPCLRGQGDDGRASEEREDPSRRLEEVDRASTSGVREPRRLNLLVRRRLREDSREPEDRLRSTATAVRQPLQRAVGNDRGNNCWWPEPGVGDALVGRDERDLRAVVHDHHSGDHGRTLEQ